MNKCINKNARWRFYCYLVGLTRAKLLHVDFFFRVVCVGIEFLPKMRSLANTIHNDFSPSTRLQWNSHTLPFIWSESVIWVSMQAVLCFRLGHHFQRNKKARRNLLLCCAYVFVRVLNWLRSIQSTVFHENGPLCTSLNFIWPTQFFFSSSRCCCFFSIREWCFVRNSTRIKTCADSPLLRENWISTTGVMWSIAQAHSITFFSNRHFVCN